MHLSNRSVAQRIEDVKSIPARPYCSNTKRIKWILPRQEAIRHPYIQLNHVSTRHITFDIDHGDIWRARDAGIAEPSIIIANRDKYGSHQIYTINPAIYPNSSTKARLLLRDTVHAYREALGADKAITTQKQLSKNPLHPKWETIWGKETTLYEMIRCLPNLRQASNIERKTVRSVLPFEACVSIGRNTSMFDYARRYAYAWVGDTASYGELYSHILQLISKTNRNELLQHYRQSLPEKEILTIAKSIARWTWKKRHTIRQTKKCIGVLGLPSRKGTYTPPRQFRAETRRRQRLGADYTAGKKRNKTEQTILNAIASITAAGSKATKKKIAEIAGLSERTVYNYSHLLVV